MPRLLPRPVRRPEGERRALADREEQRLHQKLRESCERGDHHLQASFPHTRHNCPNLPCNRCKRPGHTAPNCHGKSRKSQTPRTNDGDPPTDSIPPTRPQAIPDLGSPSLVLDSGTNFISTRSWSVPQTYQAVGLDIDDLVALGANIKGSTCPTPLVTCPDLRQIMTGLLQDLSKGEFPNDPILQRFIVPISQCGSIEELTDACLSFVEPEIFGLQGKELSPENLRQAQNAQAEREPCWPPSSGYVDFVTDDRQKYSKYVRFYVGQSSRSQVRIVCEHMAEIRRANTAALHYFILACGQGHRSANFLRLWHLPTGSLDLKIGNIEVETELVNNVLETTFCRAFESLPDEILKKLFGNPIEHAMYANVGLNVLPPLFQGQWVPSDRRDHYAKMHKDSSDPEIVEWVHARAERLSSSSRQSARQTQTRVLTAANYRNALGQLAGENGFSPSSITHLSQRATNDAPVDFKSKFENLRGVEEKECKKDFLAPMGSCQALVSIVIDSNDICVGRTDLSDDPNQLWALRGVKFDRQNSRIWTSSFEAYGSGPSRFEASSPGANRVLELNRLAVLGSSARVIVMCGLKAQGDMITAMKSDLIGPMKMILRDVSHNVWLMPEPHHSPRNISRIFIGCPEPNVSVLVRDGKSVRGITDIFGFVSAITGVERLNTAFFQNVRFYPMLKARYKREKNKEIEPMKLDKLDSESREWLWRRGFTTDANILELEKSAGSITRGMVYLLVVLSRGRGTAEPELRTTQPSDSTSRSQTYGASLQKGPRIKDPETLQRIKDLWAKVHSEHLKRIGELRRAQGDHRPVTGGQVETFFEDSLPPVNRLSKRTDMSSDLSVPRPVAKRKRSRTPDRGQDSAPPSTSPKKARTGKETSIGNKSAPNEPLGHLTPGHTIPSSSSQLAAREANARITQVKPIAAPRDIQAERRHTPIPAPVKQMWSRAKDPAIESSQDRVSAAEDDVLEDPVIDLLAEVLGEDENEVVTVLATNNRHETSKTSAQAEFQPKQDLQIRLLDGTYEAKPTEVGTDCSAWLNLSHYTKFPIRLDPASNNQQVFCLKAYLAEPGSIHPHRILGDSDLYEHSDPALRLAIQYRQGGKNSGQESRWQWASKPPSREALFRVNSVVDMLEGIPTTSIRDRPRRWWTDRTQAGTKGKSTEVYNN